VKLTEKDKNAILKAAVKARDIDCLKRWVVSLVDAIDTAEIGEGKADVSVTVPQYVETPAGNGHARPASAYLEGSLL
jgi:hypothetical protein